jgi:hypothetical protein
MRLQSLGSLGPVSTGSGVQSEQKSRVSKNLESVLFLAERAGLLVYSCWASLLLFTRALETLVEHVGAELPFFVLASFLAGWFLSFFLLLGIVPSSSSLFLRLGFEKACLLSHEHHISALGMTL